AVDGNHEHYNNLSQGREHYETAARFRDDFPATGMIFDDVPIVLMNGWYAVGNEVLWQHMMNDSGYGALTAAEVNYLAAEQAMSVSDVCEEWRENGQRGVVVTHTAPCEETLDP